MTLLGNTKSKITKNENGENFPHLEITEVLLVYLKSINNVYQHDSRVTFFCNKSSPKNFRSSKAFDSDFSYIEIWFTDQNSKHLEIKDKINIALLIN